MSLRLDFAETEPERNWGKSDFTKKVFSERRNEGGRVRKELSKEVLRSSLGLIKRSHLAEVPSLVSGRSARAVLWQPSAPGSAGGGARRELSPPPS